MHMSAKRRMRSANVQPHTLTLSTSFAFLILGCILASAPLNAQKTNPCGQAAVNKTQPNIISSAPTEKPGSFYDKNLDVHSNYPVEMRMLDSDCDMETGHRNVFGMPGETDPEHQEAKRCMKILLDLDLPKDNVPQRNADIGNLWIDDSKEYKESRKPEPIFAKIVIAELLRDCVPKESHNKEDDVLGSMALSVVSVPGLGRMPKPIWYEIGKQKIHMNSAVGRPIINRQVASAPIIVMSMATEWRGHLLAWIFTSNDVQIFNEITKSLVKFGDGPWSAMFAANIGPKGSGTSITVLPN